MNRLKEMREDKDIRANSLVITQRNYSYFETEKTMLTEDILNKLANYYNTSIDYLLYRTDERKPYTKSIIENENAK